MTVTLQLSEEVEAFVRAEVARGAAADEADFLAKAVAMYRELKVRHADLRDRVHESLAQYERGEVRPLDTEASQMEARRRFSQTR
jgi:Arc/MetJ-type ribon-helix-helix transcriptional regulator